ncbi:uncharacterized protein LOC111831100, partial [Capsella rubella]|uniref:uncharacterized protein LOC111831100 n=1 Tax=Capsella rubella TaxID=81985 RepID=UPI000CD4A723
CFLHCIAYYYVCLSVQQEEVHRDESGQRSSDQSQINLRTLERTLGARRNVPVRGLLKK